MIYYEKKIDIGGILHIILALMLAFISISKYDKISDILIWNILIFNSPMLIDFIQTWWRVPAKKIGSVLKCILFCVTIVLSISIFISLICVGITFEGYNYKDNIWGQIYGSEMSKYLFFLINPIASLLKYICDILIEETRIKNNIECDNA